MEMAKKEARTAREHISCPSLEAVRNHSPTAGDFEKMHDIYIFCCKIIFVHNILLMKVVCNICSLFLVYNSLNNIIYHFIKLIKKI